MKEYMESEHSAIFQLKLVSKNIVLRFSGIHFVHIRAKIKQFTTGGGNDDLSSESDYKVEMSQILNFTAITSEF